MTFGLSRYGIGDNKMIKVLFLINTLGGGGAEKILVETVNNLDKSKYQITVQTVFDEGVHKKDLSSNVRYKTIIPFKQGMFRSIYARFLVKILGCSFIYKFFVKDKYDYEIAFLEGLPTKIISKSKSKNGKKYAWLHTDLNAYPNSYKIFGSEKVEAKAYKTFDKIFCVSENVKTALQKKYDITHDKIGVVYNIVDNEKILSAAQENAVIPAKINPVFVSAGRLTWVKGYERLLKVHHRLINEGLAHSVMILGDGEERNALESYISENNLERTAFLVGFQKNPYKYISKSDLFICSSFAEGYSTVVSEAVICGVPVLSTDVAGAKEPIHSPRCSIVVENNEEALYAALKNILMSEQMLIDLKKDVTLRREFLKKEYLIQKFEEEVFTK